MTPSEIAGLLDAEEKISGVQLFAQAAATIRELEASLRDAEGDMNVARYELDEVSAAIGTVRFMDPPDGGSVTLAEQVSCMRDALNAAEDKLKIATDALEDVHAWLALSCIASAEDMAQGFDSQFASVAQALARMKEVG